MYTYKADLLRIVDGDTVDARINLGFDVQLKVRIRFVGINTPESRTRDLDEKKHGKAASARTKKILEAAGNKFILKSTERGKYGRALGILYVDTPLAGVELSPEGYSVNDALIVEGHAWEYHGEKRVSWAERKRLLLEAKSGT